MEYGTEYYLQGLASLLIKNEIIGVNLIFHYTLQNARLTSSASKNPP